MRLSPIVARLKASGLVRVYGALELAALDKEPTHLPAYFVIPEGWEAGRNQMAGVVDQKTTDTFGVVLLLNGAARSEDRIADDLHNEETKVVEALVGWTHPEASGPFEAAGGRMLSVAGRTLSWLVRFRTGRHIRKVSS